MDTSTIVWTIVAVLAAVVLVGLLAYFARKGRDRSVVRRRETAVERQHEADERLARAEHREADAAELQARAMRREADADAMKAQAQRERTQAQQFGAHADADRRAADEKRAEAQGLFEKTKDAAQQRTNRR
jgi:L-rhamnose isomerase